MVNKLCETLHVCEWYMSRKHLVTKSFQPLRHSHLFTYQTSCIPVRKHPLDIPRLYTLCKYNTSLFYHYSYYMLELTIEHYPTRRLYIMFLMNIDSLNPQVT